MTGSLCSGYGGLDRAAALAFGATTAWHAEIDPAASHVLKVHHPEVPNHGNIVGADWGTASAVDLMTMGIPCQPFSAAGRQGAKSDPRYLWPDALVAIRAIRPYVVAFENVRNLISIRDGSVWRTILTDLEGAGYAVRWLTMGACTVGAPHHRHRVFLLAVRSWRPGPARRINVTECDGRRPLLPTPLARDGQMRNEGSAEYGAARPGAAPPLGAVARLLPTPTARDGMGGPGHAAQGGLNLRTAAMQADWDRFTLAVRHWERLIGRRAPEPTCLGPRGGVRLAPALPEWMMGLSAGHLTEHASAGDSIRLAGNGVSEQHGAVALWALAEAFGGVR